MDNEHCMAKHGYSEFEQSATCFHCGKPLSDNRRVNELYTVHNIAVWAKGQLKILADMLADKTNEMSHESRQWFAEEIRNIQDKIKTV
jgi:hypothetical protein